MATYLILNVVFMAVVVAALQVRFRRPDKSWWTALIILIILTAVFDSLIISLGIVAYDETKLLGIRVGSAPLEDFMYPLLAAIIIPVLWNKSGRHNDE